MNNKIKQKNQHKGFSLIELLVAMSILILVIGAAVAVETQNIRIASTTKHKIQAAALGNQTMNQIRTIRDTDILKGNDPWTNLDGSDVSKIRRLILPGASKNYSLEDGSAKTTLNGVEYTVEITVED